MRTSMTRTRGKLTRYEGSNVPSKPGSRGGGGVEVKARPSDGWHADFLRGASEITADNLTYKILVLRVRPLGL